MHPVKTYRALAAAVEAVLALIAHPAAAAAAAVEVLDAAVAAAYQQAVAGSLGYAAHSAEDAALEDARLTSCLLLVPA